MILVTGSAGFIGFHLCKQLLETGQQVVGIDNFNDYYPVELKRARDAVLREHPAFVPLEIDIADLKALEDSFNRYDFKTVINLAAQPGVRYARVNPHAYVNSNLVGFVNILEMCRHHEVERLLYASSSSVYAGTKETPFREDQRVDRPVSLYGATKISNELAAHCYSHLYGLQTIGLRFFTVYGPWGRPDMAYWLFTEKITDGESIPVFNQGRMRRDFTYVDDIVDGIVRLSVVRELPLFDVMNIGNSRSEELMDMIAIIGSELGIEPVCEMLPMMDDDIEATHASIERICAACGFKPQTPLDVGLKRFIHWYREHKDITQCVRVWRSQAL